VAEEEKRVINRNGTVRKKPGPRTKHEGGSETRTIRFPAGTLTRLQSIADEFTASGAKCNVSDLVNEAVEAWLKKNDVEPVPPVSQPEAEQAAAEEAWITNPLPADVPPVAYQYDDEEDEDE